MTIERRSAGELRAAGSASAPRLAGLIPYESWSDDLGGFREIIRPGAFRRSIAANDRDQLALYAHDGAAILGRRGAGTLRLMEDARGLAFEVDLPPTTVGRDLAALVERGDVRGASFGFAVPPGGDRWSFEGGAARRELLEVDLLEVTVTAAPAYPGTEIARRAREARLPPRPRLAALRRWLETL